MLVKIKNDICRDSQAITLSQLIMQFPPALSLSAAPLGSRKEKNGTIKGRKLGQKS